MPKRRTNREVTSKKAASAAAKATLRRHNLAPSIRHNIQFGQRFRRLNDSIFLLV